MEQDIRFCASGAGTIAYATVGEGPALVMPAWWVGHLELMWEAPSFRRFVEALAQRHTVIRYDPLGTGLSERRREDDQFTLAAEVGMLEELLDEIGLDRFSVFGSSSGAPIAGAYAARHPERVNRLILHGAYTTGSEIADPQAREFLTATAREHWGVGSRVLASVFLSDSAAEDVRWFAFFQRGAATAEQASRMLNLVYEMDASPEYPRIVAPTLVLHRKDDRTIPYQLGVEVASMIPEARLQPLEGNQHLPWIGDAQALLDAVAEFMSLGAYTIEGAPGATEAKPPSEPLSPRELEVLALVAEGLSDPEIAERLVLSRHTVHRHVANIRSKLGQPSRGAAATAAARLGLI